MEQRSFDSIGHDFLVPPSFKAPMLPEWRLAYFSLVFPIPEGAQLSVDGAPFDFAADASTGWRYGRDKGVRTIENPEWDADQNLWRAPDVRMGYFGDTIVEGGRPYYNDARNRFLDPISEAVGAASVDADLALTRDRLAPPERITFDHRDLDKVRAANEARRNAAPAAPVEVPLDQSGWNPAISAHHFLFPAVANETEYSLVNYDTQVPWEDQIRGVRNSHGPATLKLISAEVMQFHDLNLTNLANEVPEPARVVSEFLIINVAAENISSATLGFLSASLTKPRNSSQFYASDVDYDHSPPQLYTLTKFTQLAIDKIDQALGRETSMRISSGGKLIATAPGAVSTFTLPSPQRVAFAIPNPAVPREQADTLSEGNNGSVPELIDAPLALASPNSEWRWHEQWAWQILTGADSYPEQVPQQTCEALQELVAAQLSSWTILTSDDGVGMVRTKSASREGMRYWSMAATRFVDLVMLQMRAQAGETHLRKSLQIVGAKSAATRSVLRGGSDQARQRALQRDLERLEKLQLDHIEIRDKLWFRRVPDRDIDTQVLKGLQRATGFDQLRDDFSVKVKSRQDVIRTQFEQLSGKIAEEEAKRAEATNLVLGFVAASIGATDWAQAAGWEGFWPSVGMGVIIFILMFVLLWVVQRLLRFWR